MRIVAIGGGHGLAQTLRAARTLTSDVTALVSMADDGGSSGRLRDEFAVPPPGDVRMALLALASPQRTEAAALWDHRFAGSGPLAGHSLGNLLLTALWQQAGGSSAAVVAGISAAAELLHVSGTVLPVSTAPHHLIAEVQHPDGTSGTLHGQAAVTTSGLRIRGIATDPAHIPACPEALAAIAAADVIVLGPGSWFTSVLAPLAVAGISAAISASNAVVVLVVNLRPQLGETDGFSTADYISTFIAAQPHLPLDVAILDRGEDVADATALLSATGVAAVVSDLDPSGTGAHDETALSAALKSVKIRQRSAARG